MESSMVAIHQDLKKVIGMQNYHRMREASHRHTAEYMNSRVQVGPCLRVHSFAHACTRTYTFTHTHTHARAHTQLVSAGEAILLIVVSIFQIVYLRSLFKDKPNRF
jgi:hypothetical protein